MEHDIVNVAQTKQPAIFTQFMNLVKNNELSHAYLFTGEDGAGQFSVAMGVAMRLFCTNVQNGMPCGKCAECVRIMNYDHPDVVVTKPDGQSIKIDQIRHVKSEFTKSAMEGSKKVFIISEAEKMTTGAANGLLKFIEEPTGNVVSFLISKNRNLVLPTIISRTQVVEFPSLSKKLMVKELQPSGVKPSEVNLMISITNSLDQIKGWLKDDWFASTQKMLEKWFIYLVKDNTMAMPFIQMSLMPLITNKDRQRIVISMMLSLFDDVLETKYGTLAEERVKYPSILEQTKLAASKWRNDQILKMLDELLDVNKSMAVNVNFQNIIEALTLKILEISKS
ncbi:DNA polymerase III subunit delta' [Lentilactobacillus kefiri]|uniref:DNA polymerase III subunit delta' n=1 Tax=Lentilactobacillus kefiri TaxID=33962 RepID=UPI0024699622|nr:DNA polymerase III subunit delta' [Lentilactobacillus kefiri]MDH5107816.1 DNA polymerase III subunit delta' [Lentilactobacillus kefiri]